MKNAETIIGYPISQYSMESCLTQLLSWIEATGKSRYLVCANPHSLIEADKDPAFSRAIHDADIVVPDGVGVVLASKINGGTIQERVTGHDIFIGVNTCLDSVGGKSCFFLGSTEETLQQIQSKMAVDFPNLKVAGTYSPPYKSLFEDEENQQILQAIRAAQPDVLWVGMTAPKQEKWIHQHLAELDVPLSVPIGAVFDFYTGRITRSPIVFQRLGMEWLPRLLQEPRRLWRRNFISSPLFVWKVIKTRLFRP
uniref:Putative GT26: N-acetylglucosaminyldiphosphoundecaprenol N-acetyl-beta-D-mannosaminyltransferase n=1 Tax=Magnetococcus massalia (strain MO-1) TaxID=451514 RepID=A0A1S7LJD7_MAGMO|nr:putative GT26 : N-acetylglucosaminyldiphosphoundecaprenol N-acetyl-beta-D-mannosaminyltransferase [Candidatus Magnetococcus massalia]